MTESIIQPEPCLRDFCMFDLIVLSIDLNTSSMSFSLIFFLLLNSNKMCYLVLSRI